MNVPAAAAMACTTMRTTVHSLSVAAAVAPVAVPACAAGGRAAELAPRRVRSGASASSDSPDDCSAVADVDAVDVDAAAVPFLA